MHPAAYSYGLPDRGTLPEARKGGHDSHMTRQASWLGVSVAMDLRLEWWVRQD